MNLSLEGKKALVCGASQGIGLAVAVELAQLGAHCTLLARNKETLQQAVASLATSNGQQHRYLVADVSDLLFFTHVIEQSIKGEGFHILVNNTGGPPAGPVVAAKPEDFLNAFQQHVLVSHLLTQALADGMKTAGYGRIINIVSTSVKIPLRNLGVSNTTRGAMASWAKTMSFELGPFGITVNNVLPGMTRTQRLDSLIAHNAKAAQKTTAEIAGQMIADIPAGRFGEAAEVAALAAFLATPAAAYINGASIPVDGGKTGSI